MDFSKKNAIFQNKKQRSLSFLVGAVIGSCLITAIFLGAKSRSDKTLELIAKNTLLLANNQQIVKFLPLRFKEVKTAKNANEFNTFKDSIIKSLENLKHNNASLKELTAQYEHKFASIEAIDPFASIDDKINILISDVSSYTYNNINSFPILNENLERIQSAYINLQIRKIKSESDDILASKENLTAWTYVVFLTCILIFISMWFAIYKPLLNVLKKQNIDLFRLMNEANVANKEKADFITHISHEIRSPMTSIINYADSLSEKVTLSTQQQNNLEAITRNAAYLLKLVDGLLEASHAEHDQSTVKTEVVNLPDLLNEVFTVLQAKAREKDLEIIFKNRTKIPTEILTDKYKLRQILFNLISNSIKFTESGWVGLAVESKNNQLEFYITDTGIGITKEIQKQLFQPFTQKEVFLNRKLSGLGLGLAISQRLASLISGKIELVQTKLNEGTTFVFTLNAKHISKFEPSHASVQKSQAISNKTSST